MTEQNYVTQELSVEDETLRDEAYSRLRIWRDGCQEIHDRARIARKVLLLQDPFQDPPNTPPEKRTLQLQTLKSTFNNCVADQVDNVVDAKLIPETAELQSIADDMNDIVRYIYECNDYQAMHKTRAEDFIGTGTAVTQIMWDADAADGNGEIALVRVPIEQFLWDPAESTIQGARALMRVTWHPLSWYESHYPDKWQYISCDEKSADAVGENENQEELGADERKAMLIEYWYRKYNNHKYTINVAYFAGRALLAKHEKVYAHGMYPFVVDVHTPIEGLPVGEGMVMELVPMMRYINRYAHYMDVNIRASAKIRLLINNSAGIKPEEVADWNNDIILGDRIGEEAIRFMESKPLTSLALQQMLQMMTDLKQDSGQNQFNRGETAGGVTAATAISSLQEAGGKQTRMRTEVLKRGFKRITEQVLWLISQFYNEGRVMMITGVTGGQREVDASPSRLFGKKKKGVLPPPPYIVRVQVERKNPNAVSEQNQLFIDAYKMSAEAGQTFPLSALFRVMNIDGKDRILPVIDASEQYTQMLTQATQENEQLKQQNADLQQSNNTLKKKYVDSISKNAGAGNSIMTPSSIAE